MASKDISTLQNAFPNIPHDIIETILESNLGDVDKAFDSLLEMSDPDFHSNDNRANDMATSTARPASQRSRVSFQEPVDNYVQPTINHWQTNSPPSRRASYGEDDQIRKDAELARKLAAEDEASTAQSNSALTTPNTSWINPRVPPPPVFGGQPSQPYTNNPNGYKPLASSSHSSSNPFNMQDAMDQIPAIHQTIVEQSNMAKQKAKDLYQQLKTINMAKHSDLVNGGSVVNGRQSNNPFTIPRVPVAPQASFNPPRPPRPVGNRTSTALDQIRADEEFARRLSEQQYRESRAQPGGNASSNQPVDHSGDALQAINPFQEDEDTDPPPYESHRNDRLVPQ
ncbi:hypothetical protein K450DRAFT_237487 [Umbelopsis ramanniana AG]|uniref:CUE domain-containing protein n=1 Tax=Umbelopsis ramanniana AG TaxID=1314678 RepID=A0AAD5EC80_UMBRA|nr:uncharacterized protein K450DRAFT_237487 [Umbelopsis ramanniana AG]KAI8580534.1 hypothetical protein K450DRAFT_237487 [Umbelopsis ramanniana AG]